MKNELTIVMYHYVRQLERTRYPAIKGRTISEFRFQLDNFKKDYQPVTVADIVSCLDGGEGLPPKAILLTFDDGYSDHFATCFPLLFDAGIQGAFFPCVAPAKRSELLDVNRIHFVLAVADSEELASAVDREVCAHSEDYNLETPEQYRAKWAVASRFDNATTIYVKRMLQVVLPLALRNQIARKLFAQYVSVDEAAFAGELYCTVDQLKVMQSSGMYVGSHGETHRWLNSIDVAEQRREIEASLAFLREVGSPADDYWVMCYPYGASDDSLLHLLKENRCRFGLTTHVSVANLGTDDALLLPRLDTNDFPFR